MSKKGLLSWLGGQKKGGCCNIRIEEMTDEKENSNYNEPENKAKGSSKPSDKVKQ